MRDCCKETIAKVKDEEPVFVIRGQDTLAPMVVSHWIDWAIMRGVSPEKIERARAHLRDILVFQGEHPERVKLPD